MFLLNHKLNCSIYIKKCSGKKECTYSKFSGLFYFTGLTISIKYKFFVSYKNPHRKHFVFIRSLNIFLAPIFNTQKYSAISNHEHNIQDTQFACRLNVIIFIKTCNTVC